MYLAQSDEDKLVFAVNKAAYTKKAGAIKASADGYEQDDPLVLSREETRGLYDREIIYEITGLLQTEERA